MNYVSFTHVDAKTRIPVTQAPARHGPAFPAVEGLSFLFAEESMYPTSTPKFYGSCPDGSNTSIPGVLETMDDATLELRRAEELERRKHNLRRQIDAIRDTHLFRNIPYTFPGDTEPDAIQLRDERDRQNIQDNMIDAKNKAPGETMHFMPLSNQVKTLTAAQMLDMGAFLKNRGDTIYTAAWTKKGQVNAAETFDALKALDLQADWPE